MIICTNLSAHGIIATNTFLSVHTVCYSTYRSIESIEKCLSAYLYECPGHNSAMVGRREMEFFRYVADHPGGGEGGCDVTRFQYDRTT